MTSATAADYAWIRTPSLFSFARDVGYAVTLVRGATPDEVLSRAGAEARRVCAGGDELIAAYWDFAEEGGLYDSSLVGAFTLPGEGGDWTLVLELGGDSAMTPRLSAELSAGTRVVAHTGNGGKPLDFFHWYEDGELRTSFEGPWHRTGATPDALNADLADLGFDPFGDPGDPAPDRKTAVLALTERLTGVRLTAGTLAAADYEVGEIPDEPTGDWSRAAADITDAHGARTFAQFRIDPL
jgi:hypothetical protein